MHAMAYLRLYELEVPRIPLHSILRVRINQIEVSKPQQEIHRIVTLSSRGHFLGDGGSWNNHCFAKRCAHGAVLAVQGFRGGGQALLEPARSGDPLRHLAYWLPTTYPPTLETNHD